MAFDRYIRVSKVNGRAAPEDGQFESTERLALAKRLRLLGGQLAGPGREAAAALARGRERC